jgi:hypothetical protein
MIARVTEYRIVPVAVVDVADDASGRGGLTRLSAWPARR